MEVVARVGTNVMEMMERGIVYQMITKGNERGKSKAEMDKELLTSRYVEEKVKKVGTTGVGGGTSGQG